MTLTRPSPSAAPAVEPFGSPLEQLEGELRWLALRLRVVVERGRRHRALGPADEYRGLYVSDEEVDALLEHGDGATIEVATLRGDAAALRAELDARAAIDGSAQLPLERIRRAFALTPGEWLALVIAVAPHLDRGYEKVFAYANDDVTRKRPTVGLALDVLCDGRDEALAMRPIFDPDAPLARHQLLTTVDEGGGSPSLLTRALQIDPHVAALVVSATGSIARLDPRLATIAQPTILGGTPAESHVVAGQRLATALRERPAARVYLGGRWTDEKRTEAVLAAREVGLGCVTVDLGALRAASDSTQSLRLLQRDTRLMRAALYLDGWDDESDAEGDEFGHMLDASLRDHPLPVFFAARAERPSARRVPYDLLVEVVEPAFADRRATWSAALAGTASETDIEQLAATFRLGAAEIRAAAWMAPGLAEWRGAEVPELPDLQAAARLQSQPRLSGVARRIEARYGWDDIVLPLDRVTQLREISVQVLHQHVVYEQWGFARKASLGRGVSALFVGESGTGKTMAAEVIGAELGLDVYKIDLSGLVSKYIGETEKNLARVFDEAAGANAILFFDEADAVFGKRSEVRDAHDRYANIEVSYLLQKIEEYEGVVVLSSNLRANLDEAFLRRLKAIIDFPFPEEDDRLRIWRLNVSSTAPLADDVDLPFMARRFRIAGGNIKNIAVLAAFLAAGEDSPIAMRHLIRATRREFQKLGRLVTESDFAHWYEEARR